MKRIVLVGGGSGGHFYPLMAVAEALNAARSTGFTAELYYFGPEPYNEESLRENNITFVRCASGKQRRYFSLLNFIDVFKVAFGFASALISLYRIYPDVVFSKGSYTSVPVTLAAWFLRIPVVIHESDTKPGLANKIAARFARYIAISFEDAAQYFPASKTALTGIPLRSVFTKDILQPSTELGLPVDKPLIFVTGGSLGAERLNMLVLESLDELLPGYVLLHQTGAAHEASIENTAASMISNSTLLEHYFVKGTLKGHEMNLAMSAASLIISRAGTGTIYEIATKGKPSIIIPIPETISHDQTENAYAYARTGAASVLEEHNFADGLLAAEITRIMGDRDIYEKMSAAAKAFGHRNAGAQIADALIGIANEHA